jgi:galactokinase
LAGGGFGGCAVALVRADKVAAICERVAAEYEQRAKLTLSLFVSRPAAGATILKA